MHIYLIGYRGSGKSTVAAQLAQRLGRRAVDTDALIEVASGQSIRELFASEGESGFRDREQAAISEVARETSPLVVATGGGAILREENRQRMLASGFCIWLQATAENLHRRIQADPGSGLLRPNLTDRGGFEEVAEILAQREPLYRQLAHLCVTTDHKSTDEVVAEICDWVNSQAQ